jgi:hypothetical protein
MSDSGTFTKGGRIWAYEKFPSEKRIGVFYEANLQEATRVSNKYGENYTGNMNGKYYVLHSGYDLQPNGSWTYGTLPPGTETSNGNANQAVALAADVGLKQQITGSPNQTQQETPDQQGGSTPTTDPNQAQTTSENQVLVYPLKITKTQQDRLKFTAVEYQPSGNLAAGTLSSQNRTSTQGKKILGTVFLPIQASISDFNSVEWQGGSINELQKQAVNLSLGAMNAGQLDSAGLTKKLGAEYARVTSEAAKASNEIKVYLAQEAIQTQNLLGRFGTVLNPNLELLFSGPQLRPFDFRFQMSAREKAEGENIKKIINFFKKNMAVKKSDGAGIFLKAPNTFMIEYKFNGPDTTHPGINQIKECALLSCSVEYTPLGTYMTYPDGTMVSYTMSLSFQELEPIYDKDYTDHPIGY